MNRYNKRQWFCEVCGKKFDETDFCADDLCFFCWKKNLKEVKKE